jgi:hypothetical protein
MYVNAPNRGLRDPDLNPETTTWLWGCPGSPVSSAPVRRGFLWAVALPVPEELKSLPTDDGWRSGVHMAPGGVG